jgi:hypothetical protein
VKKDKYTPVQMKEGAWYRMGGFTHHECCDCGLVHREEYKLEKGVMYWRTFRDDKQTAIQRKARGIGPIRAKRKG